MKLLLNVAKADPIGAHGVDTLLTLTVGAGFAKARHGIRDSPAD
jgi:hypothetical protein